MTSAPKPSGENWSRVAKAYSNFLDESDPLNPSGAACRQILDVVDTTLPFAQASYILDMGTGTGPTISSVLNSAQHASHIPASSRIVAADIAQGLLDSLIQRKSERQATDEIWKRLEVMKWDARDLTNEIRDGQVSHLLGSYAYFSFDREEAALAEAHRILQPGGLFVETSMGYTDWGHLPTFFREVRPEKMLPGPGEHWKSVAGVKATWEATGFRDAQAREYAIGIPFETHELAVETMLQSFPFVPGFIADMTEAEVKQSKDEMLRFVKEKHPKTPLVLEGVGLIGWARK